MILLVIEGLCMKDCLKIEINTNYKQKGGAVREGALLLSKC